MNISIRLSIMMFVQFFVWGAWYNTPYLWLGKIGFFSGDIGNMYSVGPIAGLISPFILGMFADRFFATERILGVMHILGAGFMFYAAHLMTQDYPDPNTINMLFLGHMLCYYPTLALTNTLALHNMTDAKRQFPLIRVFGTLGWIAAAWVISASEWDAALEMFYVAAGAALLMGIYSFSLPHTPPPLKGTTFSAREALGLDAFVLLKQPAYFFFMFCSFLICIPLAFYYQLTGRFVGQSGFEQVAGTMSYGQMSEVVFMLLMPFFFMKLGVKKMLLIGMLAWVVRYGLFAGAADGTMWMILGGIILHGICYDFFFVTGQIYTDQVAPTRIRGQAQGMLVLFTLGLGMLIGAQTAGYVEGRYTNDVAKAHQVKAAELGEAFTEMRGRLANLGEVQATALKAEMSTLASQIGKEQGLASDERPDWKMIWIIPCAGSAAAMLLFAFMFREKKGKEDEESESEEG